MPGEPNNASPVRPKVLIVDRRFSPGDLKIRRWRAYMQDLGLCFKIFQKWNHDIIWVDNGIEAMQALKEYPDQIDCVVFEAYMPGGGFTVARLIRFNPRYRHIPVFIISHQLTQADIAEGKRIGVFDCMIRPFQDPVFLESRLKKGIETQQVLKGEKVDPRAHILAELDNIANLPAMPTVYSEIEKLTGDPDATTEQYGKVIELDPGITTQMLRLCNSSAFSFTRKITTVVDAVNLLGLQTVIDFVRTLSVVGAFKGGAAGFDAEEFWRHSIACGVAAKLLQAHPEIGFKLKAGEDDPFMSGMVHDIGKQVLGYFFNEMYQMALKEVHGGKAMYAAERDILDLTHADIGAALAEKWQLPDTLVQVIGYHHTPGDRDVTKDMAHLIHLANGCSKQVGFAFAEKQPKIVLSPKTLERIGLNEEMTLAIFKELESTVRSQVSEAFAAIFA